MVGVVHADGDEGSNGGRGEVGGKEVRVLLEGSDGSGGGKAHVTSVYVIITLKKSRTLL